MATVTDEYGFFYAENSLSEPGYCMLPKIDMTLHILKFHLAAGIIGYRKLVLELVAF